MPLVSVVIPTFNRAYCIERAIDSVLSQTHADVEAIIVDDGSTDDTQSLLRSRYGAEPRVKPVYQPNTGVSGARNTGFRHAKGEFIALLDSDDTWFPWKLEAQLAVMAARPNVGMVWTDMQAVDPEGRIVDPKHLKSFYGAYRWFTEQDLFEERFPLSEVFSAADSLGLDTPVQVGEIYSQMMMGNLVHTSTVLIRRERLERVGEFDLEFQPGGEDYDFHLRTCREGAVAFLDVASIRYQRGLADRLTVPANGLPFARNFLRVIERELGAHRHRIQLSPQMLNAVFADAHAWIGEAALDLGQRGVARRHLFESLRFNRRQPRIAGLLASACLPAALGQCGRRVYHSLTAPLRPRPPEFKSQLVPVPQPTRAATR